jgi:heme exporter protein D
MLDLDMGKYAAFVWPAYGVSALTLIGMVVLSLRRSAHWRKRAEQLRGEDERP